MFIFNISSHLLQAGVVEEESQTAELLEEEVHALLADPHMLWKEINSRLI